MSISEIIKDLEMRVATTATQLEQSLANHNYMAGVKAAEERMLNALKGIAGVATDVAATVTNVEAEAEKVVNPQQSATQVSTETQNETSQA